MRYRKRRWMVVTDPDTGGESPVFRGIDSKLEAHKLAQLTVRAYDDGTRVDVVEDLSS